MRTLSGKFQIRLSPTLHEALALRAELDGVSLNKYITSALSRAVGQDEGRAKEKVA
jgi:predicted HicB family RNase H-like nuclease